MSTIIDSSMLESIVAKSDVDNAWSATQTFAAMFASSLVVGDGSGAVALTVNDGQGNCNVTFNHADGIADFAGNCGRITVNTDSTSAMTMVFEGDSNAATGAVTTVPMATMEADSGDFTAVGDVTAFSDERVKTDWKALTGNFIEKLAGLLMGTYARTDRPSCDTRQVGVGAQSLREFLPEAVSGDESIENLSVAYGNAALASCVELAREVLILRERLDKLESK